jgi:hypothetical protein
MLNLVKRVTREDRRLDQATVELLDSHAHGPRLHLHQVFNRPGNSRLRVLITSTFFPSQSISQVICLTASGRLSVRHGGKRRADNMWLLNIEGVLCVNWKKIGI